MCRFHQRNAAGTGRAVEVEQQTGKEFATVSLMDETRTMQVRMEADALEASAQAMMIAARRIREAAAGKAVQ